MVPLLKILQGCKFNKVSYHPRESLQLFFVASSMHNTVFKANDGTDIADCIAVV